MMYSSLTSTSSTVNSPPSQGARAPHQIPSRVALTGTAAPSEASLPYHKLSSKLNNHSSARRPLPLRSIA